MISEELEFQIGQYADGSLPTAEMADVEAAIAADAEARALLEEYRKLDVALKREVPAIPEIEWDRLAEHISAAVADEDRATTTLTISTWWIRSAAVAAVVVIATTTAILWPLRNSKTVATGPDSSNPPPAQVALIEVGGPEVTSKPAVEEISVEPSALAEAENLRITEDIVYRPSRVVINSVNVDRQDSSRLPY